MSIGTIVHTYVRTCVHTYFSWVFGFKHTCIVSVLIHCTHRMLVLRLCSALSYWYSNLTPQLIPCKINISSVKNRLTVGITSVHVPKNKMVVSLCFFLLCVHFCHSPIINVLTFSLLVHVVGDAYTFSGCDRKVTETSVFIRRGEVSALACKRVSCVLFLINARFDSCWPVLTAWQLTWCVPVPVYTTNHHSFVHTYVNQDRWIVQSTQVCVCVFSLVRDFAGRAFKRSVGHGILKQHAHPRSDNIVLSHTWHSFSFYMLFVFFIFYNTHTHAYVHTYLPMLFCIICFVYGHTHTHTYARTHSALGCSR